MFKQKDIVALRSDWHGVPAGTQLRIVRGLNASFYGEGCWQVTRVDGEALPAPNSSRGHPAAVIHEEFLAPCDLA